MLLLLATAALAGETAAVDPAVLRARLAEIKPLLSERISSSAPKVPASAWDEAATGEIVTGVFNPAGQKTKMGWGVAVLDVPMDRMWAGLNEELHHKELVGLDHVELVKGGPCEDHRRVMMILPLPVVSDRWWVVQNHYNTVLDTKTDGRVRELTWKSVDDPAAEALSAEARAKVQDAVLVASTVGGWFLVDLDGKHTLAEYHAWTDPGGRIPAGAVSTFANATIEDTVRKVAGYAKTAKLTCPGR
jgi:hypothetical protein